MQKAAFNRKETARYLGISENTLAKLLNSGAISHVKAGRRILVSKHALDRFLEEGVVLEVKKNG